MKKLSLTLILSFLLTLSAFAGDKSSDKLVRPSSCPRLEGTVVTTNTDDFEENFFILKGTGLEFKMPPLAGWVEDDSNSSASYALKYRTNPNVRLSFNLYSKSAFLSTLDDDTAKSYANLLVRELGPDFKISNPEKSFFVKNSFFIFNERYALVEGEYHDPAEDLIMVKDFLIPLTNISDYFLVIRLEGESRWIQSLMGAVNRSFGHSLIVE